MKRRACAALCRFAAGLRAGLLNFRREPSTVLRCCPVLLVSCSLSTRLEFQ